MAASYNNFVLYLIIIIKNNLWYIIYLLVITYIHKFHNSWPIYTNTYTDLNATYLIKIFIINNIYLREYFTIAYKLFNLFINLLKIIKL